MNKCTMDWLAAHQLFIVMFQLLFLAGCFPLYSKLHTLHNQYSCKLKIHQSPLRGINNNCWAGARARVQTTTVNNVQESFAYELWDTFIWFGVKLFAKDMILRFIFANEWLIKCCIKYECSCCSLN